MTLAAALCFTFALVAELVGVGLVVGEARAANRALAHYLALNPRGNPGGSYAQIGELQPVLVTALGNQSRRTWAVALLASGVIAGTVGNFLGSSRWRVIGAS